MTIEHRLSETFFQGLTKRILSFSIPLSLLALGAAWYMSEAGTDGVSIISLVIVATVLAFTMARTLRRQKRSFRSFCIRVEEDRLARVQDGYPPLEIAFADITKISEQSPHGLTVQGSGPHQAIFLFSSLERFDELRARLAAHHPIEKSVPKFWSVPKLLGMILGPLVALVVVFRSDSPPVVWVAGCLALGVLACCVVTIARSPHVERSAKRGLWWMIPVVLSICLKMWFVVWGWK